MVKEFRYQGATINKDGRQTHKEIPGASKGRKMDVVQVPR